MYNFSSGTNAKRTINYFVTISDGGALLDRAKLHDTANTANTANSTTNTTVEQLNPICLRL